MIGIILCALLIAVVLLVWLVVNFFVKRSSPLQQWRGAITAFAIAALLVLAFMDEIIGGYQFNELCRANAGLKVDAKKINGKTISSITAPVGEYMTNTAIPIRYSHTSYRDREIEEELASANSYVAESGWLLRALVMGQSVPPLLIQPSACSGPGNLPLAKKFNFTYEVIRVSEDSKE